LFIRLLDGVFGQLSVSRVHGPAGDIAKLHASFLSVYVFHADRRHLQLQIEKKTAGSEKLLSVDVPSDAVNAFPDGQ